MLLTPQDVELFFKLHRSLMFFVNQRLKVIPDDLASPMVWMLQVNGSASARAAGRRNWRRSARC